MSLGKIVQQVPKENRRHLCHLQAAARVSAAVDRARMLGGVGGPYL
jgi:hypothetical protein